MTPSPSRSAIIAASIALFAISGCSIEPLPSTQVTSSALATAHVDPTDYIQLAFGGFKGLHRTIRIYGDGRVERDTATVSSTDYVMGCPLHESDTHTHIPAGVASNLIANAKQSGFYALKESYVPPSPVLDGGSSELKLSVAGIIHVVSDRNGSAPDVYFQISKAIEKAEPKLPSYAHWPYGDARQHECERSYRQSETARQRLRLLFP